MTLKNLWGISFFLMISCGPVAKNSGEFQLPMSMRFLKSQTGYWMVEYHRSDAELVFAVFTQLTDYLGHHEMSVAGGTIITNGRAVSELHIKTPHGKLIPITKQLYFISDESVIEVPDHISCDDFKKFLESNPNAFSPEDLRKFIAAGSKD